MKSITLSIIVPTFKEALNIPILSEKIAETLKKERISYEIVVIDDNSNDGIDKAVENLQTMGHPINLIIRKTERGLSSAVIEGIRIAQGDYLLVMDADLSHPVESIPSLLKPLVSEGADFCIGSRFVKGGSSEHFNWFRKLNARVSKVLALPFTNVKDPMAGFFAFPRTMLKDKIFILNPLGFKIGLELIVKCNPKKIVEVPIEFQERLFGESKLTLKEQVNYILHLKRLFEYKYRTLAEFILFGLIGSICTIVDLFSVFISYDLLSIKFRFSRLIGIVFALGCIFFLNKRLILTHSLKESRIFQYIKFFGVYCLGFCISWLFSVYLYENCHFFNTHYLLAVFIGIIGGMAVHLPGSRLIVVEKTCKS
ncbi:MAG TPA: glycosyltransferase family 2 protein [Spirochaetota bacterium]|nr:glycosyltransferase family 2 protein [Spirochaetota bacterium]